MFIGHLFLLQIISLRTTANVLRTLLPLLLLMVAASINTATSSSACFSSSTSCLLYCCPSSISRSSRQSKVGPRHSRDKISPRNPAPGPRYLARPCADHRPRFRAPSPRRSSLPLPPAGPPGRPWPAPFSAPQAPHRLSARVFFDQITNQANERRLPLPGCRNNEAVEGTQTSCFAATPSSVLPSKQLRQPQ